MIKTYDISFDSDYLYICAELKEREKEFIDKPRMERLLNSSSKTEFLKILQETYYSKYNQEIEKSSLEVVSFFEGRKNLEMLEKHLKKEHQSIKQFYLLQADLHNVKVVMKSVLLEKDIKDIFLNLNYTQEDLRESYISGKRKNIDEETFELLNYAISLVHKEKNQRIRELNLEKHVILKIYNSIKKTDKEMLIDLIKHRIDMYNIKNIYRAKYAKEKMGFEVFLFDGGFLSIDYLKRFEKESVDYFVQEIEKTAYVKMIFQGTHLFHTENTFAAFERNEDGFILSFLEQAKYSVAGVENLAYFILRKSIEIKNLNIMYSSALYGIDKARVKDRIVV